VPVRVEEDDIAYDEGIHLRVRRKSQSIQQTARSWISCERAREGDNEAIRKLEFALAVLMKAKCWQGWHSAKCVGTCS
jgi:hypothetical protein